VLEIKRHIEVQLNTLASTPLKGLKEHFDTFCLPASLRECVDQCRMDRLDAAMKKYRLVSDDLWRLTVREEVPFRSFSEVFDPFTYFADYGHLHKEPGTQVVMPPVPTAVFSMVEDANLAVVQTDILRLANSMKDVPTSMVLGLAWAVAAYYLDDEPCFGDSRMDAIRYIALNDIQSDSRLFVVKPDVWKNNTRTVTLPDMVEKRKAEFRELFARIGQPLDEAEFDCMPLSEIVEYAADQRSVLLGQNRHIVLCSRCCNLFLDMMGKLQQQMNGMLM